MSIQIYQKCDIYNLKEKKIHFLVWPQIKYYLWLYQKNIYITYGYLAKKKKKNFTYGYVTECLIQSLPSFFYIMYYEK